MQSVRRWMMVGLALAAVLGVDAVRRAQLPEVSRATASLGDLRDAASQCNWSRASRQMLPMPAGVGAAHASNLLVLPPSHPDHARTAMMAFWFAGTRESAADVQIVASRLDRSTLEWSPPFTVVDRDRAGQTLGVRLRRLGNPVAWADAQGRLHLFVVGTGLGGWAASRVVHLLEDASRPQERWQPLHVMPLMPLVPSLKYQRAGAHIAHAFVGWWRDAARVFRARHEIRCGGATEPQRRHACAAAHHPATRCTPAGLMARVCCALAGISAQPRPFEPADGFCHDRRGCALARYARCAIQQRRFFRGRVAHTRRYGGIAAQP